MYQHIKDYSNAKERLTVEISRKYENQTEGNKFEKARGFVRRNWSSKRFDPQSNPLIEDTSSSGSEEAEMNAVLNSRATGKPPTGPSGLRKNKNTRFEDDDDFMIYDDNDDDEEQLDKMKRLEADRKTTKNRGATSAFSKASTSTRIVDLTSDQISYGIRPSTVVQLEQIKALNEFNKALPKKKQSMAFPMLQATNIGTSEVIKRDHKKKKVELITRYNQVGFVDDYFVQSDEEGVTNKYSL